MAAGMGVIKLVCMAVIGLLVQLCSTQEMPLNNYPPDLTDHTLELTKTNQGEEEVLEGTHNKSWVLGFYFLTSDNDTLVAGVVINHNAGQDNGEDLMMIYSDISEYTLAMEEWANIVSQLTPPFTHKLQMGSTWLSVTVEVAGEHQLLRGHNLPESIWHFPLNMLAAFCHDIDCDLERKECNIFKLHALTPHGTDFTLSTVNDVMFEGVFTRHPPHSDNIWYLFLDVYTGHNTNAMTGMIIYHVPNRTEGEDSLIVWYKHTGENETKYIEIMNPWTYKTSEMKTPLTLKFQVGVFGMRLYEIIAGQNRLVGRTNITQTGFPHVFSLGLRCFSTLNCGSISSSCSNE